MATPRLTLSSPARRSGLQAGFSLVELLMVAFILAIGLLGLGALQVVSTAQSASSRERGTANLIAHSVLDRVQSEGSLSAAERLTTDTVTSTGFTFIAPADLTTAHDSTTAESLAFNVRGDLVAATAADKVFTLTWRRQNGVSASLNTAYQEFIVNVSWKEAVHNTSGQIVVVDKTISVSRYVRV